jgi:hypothetical protein
MVVLLLMAALGVALSSSSLFQLWATTREVQQAEITHGARSVVAAAVESLYTSDAMSFDGSLDLEPAGVDWARLTFDLDQAQEWQIPHSTTNIGGTGTILGYGDRPVPPGAVHLIGVSREKEVERSVEALIQVVEFPYAVAATGPITFKGKVTIATLSPDEELLPADIVSNSSSDEAVVFSSETMVTGDAQAVGGVKLPDSEQVDIWGEVRSGADPVQFPQIKLSNLDPATLGGNYEDLSLEQNPPAPLSPVPLEGAARADGPLVVNGDLDMQGALLYSTQSIHIKGDLTGTGILAAQGFIQVDGMSTLDGANRLALVSGGQVTLKGTGAASSMFKGLVACEGFSADQVTVRGSLVVNGDETSAVTLEDTQVYYEPVSVQAQALPSTVYPSFLGSSSPGGTSYILVFNMDDNQIDIFDTLQIQNEQGIPHTEFVQNPLGYPDAIPRTSVPFDPVIVGSAPALDDPDYQNFQSDLTQALEGLDELDDLFWDQASDLIFNDIRNRFDTMEPGGSGGMEFIPGYTLTLDEFLRPEEKTKLLFWREAGRI